MSTSFINTPQGIVDVDDLTSLPANRGFRNAWQLNGTVIEVDMVAARVIHQDKIRAVRSAEFAVNDVALQDAMVDDDAAAKTTAVARRDALRAAPQDAAIAAATTPEELSNVWPAGLSAAD